MHKRGLDRSPSRGHRLHDAPGARRHRSGPRQAERREPLTEQDIVTYLAHSRVTEQRASEQMALLLQHFGDHPEIGRAVRQIARDEDNHLAYCHEELLRLAAPATAG